MSYEQGTTYDQGTMQQYGNSSQMEQQRQSTMDTAKHTMEKVEGIPANVYYGGVIGSIAASAILMMMGKRNLSLFVGLWPPTILNLALFTKQLKPSREFDSMQGSMQGSMR
jgi:hypothetical protein